jgi:hypothetical protein
MTQRNVLRSAAGWLLVLGILGWLQTSPGIAAYDRLLQSMDPPAIRRARADSVAAVAQARLEAAQRRDAVVAAVVSPPLSGRNAATQRAELRWVGAIGIPLALLGFVLDTRRFLRARRGSAGTMRAASR